MFAGVERTISVDYSVYWEIIVTGQQVIVLPTNINDRQVLEGMFAGVDRTVSVDYRVYWQVIATDQQGIVLPANVNNRQVKVKRLCT